MQKVVYRLADELTADPERAELAQALTLNANRPLLGLRGRHGLFGSAEWWESIKSGRMPLRHVSGVITRVYFVGMDAESEPNAVDLLDDDGVLQSQGVYLNRASDRPMYAKGRRIEFLYALDELKAQPGPDGKTNYSEIALEVSISTSPEVG